MRRSRAFTFAELLTAVALVSLTCIYAYTMIGCNDGGGGSGGGKDSKASIDSLTKRVDALEARMKTMSEYTGFAEEEERLAEQKKHSESLNSSDPSVRGKARAMQSMTQVRGIHSGCVLYAQGNKDWYPGLTSDGKKSTVAIPADTNFKSYGFDGTDGTLVVYRLAVLMRGNYFSPEYIISPGETHHGIKPPEAGVNMKDGANYSFAMLNITDLDKPRAKEWFATQNSRSAVITDRNIGSGATGADAQSLHTTKGQGWKGAVVYNDNHSQFETSDVIRSEYDQKGEIAADKLFSDMEKTDGGTAGADAAMVFKAGDSYVNQNP